MVLSATSDDDDRTRPVPAASPACCERFAYARLYNLYLDPKETHNYLTRKLAYVEAFQLGIRIASRLRSSAIPPKKVMGLKAPNPRPT